MISLARPTKYLIKRWTRKCLDKWWVIKECPRCQNHRDIVEVNRFWIKGCKRFLISQNRMVWKFISSFQSQICKVINNTWNKEPLNNHKGFYNRNLQMNKRKSSTIFLCWKTQRNVNMHCWNWMRIVRISKSLLLYYGIQLVQLQWCFPFPPTILFFKRLHEIVSVYQKLSPPNLSYDLSNRVCNVLGLLQALALHQSTRYLFVKA